jgi:mannose/fructose/N-acetylgalactosamine-specific phosphotransferase system component IIC
MILAAGIGALAGADRTAFAQTMLAHPLICGTLSGWIAGDPESGLRLGIVFGMLASRRAPIGGAGPVVDWTSAAIAVPFALGPSAAGWQWGLGLVAGLVVALAGGHVIRGVRSLAARAEPRVQEAAMSGDLGVIERTHLGFLGLHTVRGAVVALAGAMLISGLAFDLRWSGPEQSAASMIWAFAPLVAATVLVDSLRTIVGWRSVGFGGLVGLTIVLWVVVLS